MMIQFEKIAPETYVGDIRSPAHLTGRGQSSGKSLSLANAAFDVFALLYMLVFIFVTGFGFAFAVLWFLFF